MFGTKANTIVRLDKDKSLSNGGGHDDS
jgi:hypothetical protein